MFCRMVEVEQMLKSRNDESDTELTIGDVAARSGFTTSALRFYEREGLIAAVRTDGNQRRYRRDVLRRIAFVRTAQTVGLSLEEIRDALSSLPDKRTPTANDWNRLATAWTDRLNVRIEALENLRDRLDSCIGCGCLSLERCSLYNPGDIAARLGSGPRYFLGDTSTDAKSEARPST